MFLSSRTSLLSLLSDSFLCIFPILVVNLVVRGKFVSRMTCFIRRVGALQSTYSLGSYICSSGHLLRYPFTLLVPDDYI